MKKITGLDLSNYIIGYSLQKSKPVSDLQLQKILYFVNGEYYNLKRSFIIDDAFYAYPLGPVSQDVYNVYRAYGASKIKSYTQTSIGTPDEEKTVNNILDKYISMSASELVNASHKKGGAWDRTRNTKGLYSKIDIDLIMQEFN